MKRKIFSRLTAAFLCLTLLLTSGVQAITPEQMVELLEEYYVDEIPEAVYEQTTVSGMLNALGDPYTEYFPPKNYEDFLGSMSDDSLVGIGIAYTVGEDGLLISEALANSPAEEKGLQAGDVIVAVDGKSVKGEAANNATELIRGEEGTDVRVSYIRNGRRKSATLTRALVVVPATTSKLIDGHIGYINCTTFGEETVGHFEEAIDTYGGDVTCWIVDLRDNLGGVTSAATEAAGLFTGKGEMAYFRDGLDQYSVFFHEEGRRSIEPVIVLMNENSASSSEIFAAAIQGRESGIVIGTRSYGKGVAQIVLDQDSAPEYFADGDAVKITAYRFFSAIGNTPDQVGVLPDLITYPEVALEVACMLAGPGENAENEQPLRIDLGYKFPWRWLVDLKTVTKEENLDLFELLLNSLSAGVRLWFPAEGNDEWEPVTAEELCETYGLTYYPPLFSDHEESDYGTALSILWYYGLINGKDDGAFHPKDTLTRAELCQMLAEALACTVPENSSPFSDVEDDAWYAPAVTAISNMGLVNGVGDGTFHPEDPVDHQQFLTIMGRLIQWLNMFYRNSAEEMPAEAMEMEELSGYSDWARPSVWLLSASQQGVLGGYISLLWDVPANIAANEPTTRDEAAFTLYQVLSYIGVLPV